MKFFGPVFYDLNSFGPNYSALLLIPPNFYDTTESDKLYANNCTSSGV